MATLWQDVKQGFRALRRSPAFALVAILTLALGIGANTAIFSIVNGVLLRPLAYEQPEQLYLIHEVIPEWHKFAPTLPANLPDFRIWQQRVRSFQGIAIAEYTSADLTGVGAPVEIDGVRCSANLFEVLGVPPLLGRGFLPSEDEAGRGHVVVLTDWFWRSRFGGDRSLVGKTIDLDGVPAEVVGVLPRTFHFLGSSRPAFFEPLNGPKPYERDLIGEFDFMAIGRLAPHVTASRALAELDVVQAQIAAQAKASVTLRAQISPLEGEIVGPARSGLLFLLLAVGAVLLIVCLNLANMLLSRVPGRMREAAIRTALGATRKRLARRMLTESLLLGLMGSALGMGLAWLAVHWLVHVAPAGIPRLDEVTIDGRVVWFAAALGILTGAIFGMLPAARLAHAEPMEALKSGATATTESRETRRVRNGLVGLEVGLSTVLLILAGLLVTSLVNVLDVDMGFSPDRVLAADVALPLQDYKQPEARLEFYDRVVRDVRALPAVREAGWASMRPLQGQGSVTAISVPGGPQSTAAMPEANYRAVSSDYFAAMGIPVLAGRSFNETDRDRNVVVVSRSVAEHFWPGQDPIGKICLTHWGPTQQNEVIGVVGDVRVVNPSEPPLMMVYVPDWFGGKALGMLGRLGVLQRASIVVGTKTDPVGVAAAVRRVIHDAGPDVPIVALQPMTQALSASVETRRFEMFLGSAFGVFALFLAALGIFGVVAYSVEQRRHELAIRVALGGDVTDLRGMILRQGMVPVVLGLGAGIVLALWAARLIGSLLFGVRAYDPLNTAFVALAVVAVGLAACYLPARRATRVDPVVSLREE